MTRKQLIGAALALATLASCEATVEFTGAGAGGMGGTSTASTAQSSTSVNVTGGGQPCGGHCVSNGEVCVHEGGCDTPGTCQPTVGGDECFGVCTCEGAFLCTSGEAKSLGLPLTKDTSCLVCGEAREALVAALPTPRDTCTWVARYRYTDREPISVGVVCDQGRMTAIDPRTAQTIAEAALGPTDAPLVHLQRGWSHIFWTPAEVHGGIAAVSAFGAVPLAGTSIAGGMGQILEPETWLDGAWLSVPCGLPKNWQFDAHGWDLRDGSELPAADAALIGDLVSHSVLRVVAPAHLGIEVLLYPRSVEPFAPETAEWIALVTDAIPVTLK